ncbi:MAG: hypothetical protein ABEH35_03385 [Haloarculaceae archaeon]
MSRLRRFLLWYLTALVLFAPFALVGLTLPPDAILTLAYSVPGIVVSLALAYYLVYRGGFQQIREALD